LACCESVDSFMEIVQLGDELLELRRSLHTDLFTEECCILFRGHLEMLRTVFDGYRVINCYPGRSAKHMSYGAWMELVNDSRMIDKDYSCQNIGRAFSLAKEIAYDETKDWRHMELSWGEFLVALGALVLLKPGYSKEFLSDDLEELFFENLEEARKKINEKTPGRARSKQANIDPTLAPMVAFLTKLFEDADTDSGGEVDFKEFRRAFGQPQYKKEMETFQLTPQELEMLFKVFDKDGTGQLSLDELIDGFCKMKSAMKGLDRAVSWIKRAFGEADLDGSGSLTQAEFRAVLEQPAALRKLESLGISADDIADLFDVVGSESGEITVDQIVEGFVKLRNPKNVGLRGLRILGALFDQADDDGSGELSKEEVIQAFGNDEVATKLKNAKLSVPEWGPLFEELDVDGSGELSWEEIAEGMKAYWAKDQF